MKKTIHLLLALAFGAGLCLPAAAQDEEAALKENTTAEAEAKPEKKPEAKKPAPKKKAKKKKKTPPPSEYKFDAVEKVETYKFDKKANPIVKKKPAKKKPAAKKGEKAKEEAGSEKAKDPKSLDEKSVKFDPEKGTE